MFPYQALYTLFVIVGAAVVLNFFHIVQFEKVDNGCGCGGGDDNFYGWKATVGRVSIYLTIQESKKIGWNSGYFDSQIYLFPFVIEWEK